MAGLKRETSAAGRCRGDDNDVVGSVRLYFAAFGQLFRRSSGLVEQFHHPRCRDDAGQLLRCHLLVGGQGLRTGRVVPFLSIGVARPFSATCLQSGLDGYTEYTFTVNALSPITALEFQFFNGIFSNTFYLDDVQC